jgi:tricarballylate dehydrogenase
MRLESYDVIIAGAGNAGLTCAIAAAEMGKRVLVIEKAKEIYKGGNSSLTMNFRFSHQSVDELLDLIDDNDKCSEKTKELKEKYQPYSEFDFLNDIMKVNDHQSSIELSKTLVENSLSTIKWMRRLGHQWIYKDSGNILPRSVPVRIKGRGAGLQAINFSLCKKLGVNFLYNCALIDFHLDDDVVSDITIEYDGKIFTSYIKSLVIACGGYQANNKLVRKYLGDKWGNVPLRGVPFNTGDGHDIALRNGISLSSGFGGCHATPQGANIKKYRLPGDNDDSQNSSRYLFNLGITVNKYGERFFDEGGDYPNFIYSKIGELIVEQDGEIAFQILDKKHINKLSNGYFVQGGLFSSRSLESLSKKLGISKDGLATTLVKFNDSLKHISNPIDINSLDGNNTIGLDVNKSNWAEPFDGNPFYVAPIQTGLTFTYGGMEVNKHGNVRLINGNFVRNLYACGECMGGVHIKNYAGGTGLMLGSVFGKIIGSTS